MKIAEFWDTSLSKIADKVGESAFELWFKPMKLLSLQENVMTIGIPNRFFREWIEDYYPSIINEMSEEIIGHPVSIKYKIIEKEDATLKKQDTRFESRKKMLAGRGIFLNPRFTFDSFVVGPSNNFAHAACMKSAGNPAAVYNPLFIYGDVGLGKTHLMQAIGNMIVDQMVCYLTAERFTNEAITSMRSGGMQEFKDKYRNVDVLLIDDIDFIDNKKSTQEEFFHTFNALHEKNSQIVMTSDKPPTEIVDITERLRSRFVMGLIAGIQYPEIETKVAIISKKAANEKMPIPEDVAYFIATKVKSNIRDLEGCLIKLWAHTSLTGRPIDTDMAKDVLKDIISVEEKVVTVELIQKITCEHFGLKIQDIKAKKRTKEISNARQIAMYIAKQMTHLSLTEIGKYFGGKDHATIIYACRQVEKKKGSDENLNANIENIRKKISG